MKEKPIIFSTPMVQALLNTKPNTWPAEPIDPSRPYKCQTRRVAKHQYGQGISTEASRAFTMVNITFGEERTVLLLIPHYWWGDILLVRETWSVFHDDTGYDYLYYKADEGNPDKPKCFMPWKPSISMPRIVSRLFLEVKNVRIERLRNITAIDAFKEGFMNDPLYCPCFLASGDCPFPYDCPVCGFRQTWDSMNAKCGYPWESNPWVWVYEFMRLA